MGITHTVFKILAPFKKVLATLLGLLVLGEVFLVLFPVVYGKIVDTLVSGTQREEVWIWVWIGFALFIANVITKHARQIYEVHRFDFDIPKYISLKTLEKMFGLSLEQHSNENSGLRQSVVSKGENSITQFAYTLLYQALPLVAQVILTIGVFFWLSPLLAGLILLGVSVFVFFTLMINKKHAPRVRKIEDDFHRLESMRTEALRNIREVALNSQETETARLYTEEFERISKYGKWAWTNFVLWIVVRSIFLGIVKFLVIAIGVVYVYNGTYTTGYLIIFLLWTQNIFGSLHMVANMQRNFMEMSTSIKQFSELLDTEPTIHEPAKPLILENIRGEISFKNVSFSYPTGRTNKTDAKTPQGDSALKKVNFTIHPQQKVAFVGPSGSGKTTIVNLLIRASDPNHGKVYIDGHDITMLAVKDIRRNIGVVSQDPSLWDTSLKENLLFATRGTGRKVTDKDMATAVKQSCISTFLDRLSQGIETLIGERGVKLSGGERQRIVIGRVLLKDPAILVFDEATSNLDTRNERDIMSAISTASRGKTTIIIAHRLSTVREADVIFVMDKGRIIDSGTHDYLVEKCEVYKDLVSAQL